MFSIRISTAALAVSLICNSAFGQAAEAEVLPLVAGLSSVSTSDGVALKVNIAGQGLPCLFLHGGPGSGSEVVQRLAGKTLEQHFKMIYLDQRGSGRSASDPAKQYSLDRVVQDLEELRERLQIKQWVVMSHSFGGIIASAYAKKHPERIRGIVLMNSILNLGASMESTAAYGYTLLPAQSRPPMDPAAPLPQRFGMVMGMLGQAKLTGKLMYSDGATEARVDAAMKGLPANRDLATTLFQSGAIMSYIEDFTPSTVSMTMPVLVISGKDDHVVGIDHYKSFRFPNQQVALVPGRHFSMLEQPAEVGKALENFAAALAKPPKR